MLLKCLIVPLIHSVTWVLARIRGWIPIITSKYCAFIQRACTLQKEGVSKKRTREEKSHQPHCPSSYASRFIFIYIQIFGVRFHGNFQEKENRLRVLRNRMPTGRTNRPKTCSEGTCNILTRHALQENGKNACWVCASLHTNITLTHIIEQLEKQHDNYLPLTNIIVFQYTYWTCNILTYIFSMGIFVNIAYKGEGGGVRGLWSVPQSILHNMLYTAARAIWWCVCKRLCVHTEPDF